MLTATENVLQENLSQLKQASTVYLAFSGGMDSTVLFDLLLKNQIQFKALHVNHQLSDNAEEWQYHCEHWAQQHAVEITVYKVKVENRGEGLEDAARQARYHVFEQCLQKQDILLTAHHANDQSETLLFRMFRGSGLTGLLGIKKERKLGLGNMLRPMLGLSRKQIEEYAQRENLQWINDESNSDVNFDRNFIRQKLIPLISTRWPRADQQIARCAEFLNEEKALLNEYASQDLKTCDVQKARLGESLSLSVLCTLSPLRQKHVLRYWLESQGLALPSEPQLRQIEKIITARQDAKPEVKTRHWIFRRFADRLYLHPPENSNSVLVARDWHSETPLQFEDGSCLICIAGEATHFNIRFRQGGEKCRPANRMHSQSLKKLLQEYKLEPWWRDQVPLIYKGATLVAVGDLFVCEGAESWSFAWKLH